MRVPRPAAAEAERGGPRRPRPAHPAARTPAVPDDTAPQRADPARVTARSTALDGLRGWAALSVLFYHSILALDPTLIERVLVRPIQHLDTPGDAAIKAALVVLNGEVAVSIFFVISGLVLFRSLRGLMARGAGWGTWAFVVRRVLRLYPLLVVCLGATYALQEALGAAGLPHAEITPEQLWRNMLLLDWGVSGATWTLHAEVALIPALLLLFVARRLFGIAALLGAVAVSVLAFPLRARLGLDAAVVAAGPYVMAGALVESGVFARWVRPRFVPPLLLLGLLAELAFLPQAGSVRLLLQIALVSLFVAHVHHARAHRLDVLHRPVSQHLGRLSYGVYLWNVPIFEAMVRLTDPALRADHALGWGLAIGVSAAVLTLPLAAVSERWIERPCIALGRRLTARPAAAATPTRAVQT